MTYVHWLGLLSVVFVGLERLWPRYPQGLLRRGILTDLCYLVFNGHYLGVAMALVTTPLVARLDELLGSWQLRDSLYLGVASHAPAWLQFSVAFVAVDLLHWSVHNLLHRVPALWSLHKVHHSIVDMDWIGSLRFHWGEVVVYKSLTYPVLAFFGFDSDVLLTLAVVSTAIGHCNHANLRWRFGPLKYVLNSPEMHVWHHNRAGDGPPMYNFGINLSIWDWIFRTAYLPSTPPEALGFNGIDSFPRSFPAQLLYPLIRPRQN